jgi:cbb3-type cytochrome c oxidase subunit III
MSMSKQGMAGRAIILLLGFAVMALAAACESKKPQPVAQNTSQSPDTALIAHHQRGREAFLAYCGMCHGAWGEGDGPMAAQLKKSAGVLPAQLNDQVMLDSLGRAEVVRIITMGGARTHRSNLMPPWGGKLDKKVIDEIADYVMVQPSMKPGIPRSTIDSYFATSPGTSAEGRKLFVFYCTICHGPQGKGNGFLADTMWARFKVRPRDLTDSAYFAPKTDKELFVTVTLGAEYTGHSNHMPGWGVKFTPQQVRDLVSYIHTLSRTPPVP